MNGPRLKLKEYIDFLFIVCEGFSPILWSICLQNQGIIGVAIFLRITDC